MAVRIAAFHSSWWVRRTTALFLKAKWSSGLSMGREPMVRWSLWRTILISLSIRVQISAARACLQFKTRRSKTVATTMKTLPTWWTSSTQTTSPALSCMRRIKLLVVTSLMIWSCMRPFLTTTKVCRDKSSSETQLKDVKKRTLAMAYAGSPKKSQLRLSRLLIKTVYSYRRLYRTRIWRTWVQRSSLQI